MLISLKRSFEGIPILCKENQHTPQPNLPDDQGLTNSFRQETFHIRELSIRTMDAVKVHRPRDWASRGDDLGVKHHNTFLPGFVEPMKAKLVDSIRPGDWLKKSNSTAPSLQTFSVSSRDEEIIHLPSREKEHAQTCAAMKLESRAFHPCQRVKKLQLAICGSRQYPFSVR